MLFREIDKFCLWCGCRLTLNNTRDIERKNFCNHSCKAKYYQRLGVMSKPPVGVHTKPHSEETKKYLSKINSGKNHPRWIDDRSKLNVKEDRRYCFEYRKWRQQVFERDNYTCRKCNQRGGELEAHHMIPYAVEEYRYSVWNGLTLCLVCHKKIHKEQREWKMELRNAYT